MDLKTAFSNGKSYKNVLTVGQMIEELQRLPSDLLVDQGYDGDGTDIVIFNIGKGDTHVHFGEGQGWDYPDEDEEDD